MCPRLPVLPVCLILSLLLAAPSVGAERDLDAILLAYVDVWSSGELHRLDEIIAPDFRRHGGPDESCSSRQQLKNLIEQTRTIYKHVRLSIDDHMTAGDEAVSRPPLSAARSFSTEGSPSPRER